MSEFWMCDRCGGTPKSHGASDSKCVYEPVLVQGKADEIREALTLHRLVREGEWIVLWNTENYDDRPPFWEEIEPEQLSEAIEAAKRESGS